MCCNNLPSGATTWNHYESYIFVPNAPSIQQGQTLFYFGGLEDANGMFVMQPVLQWGSSGAGGGNYWSYANWLYGSGYIDGHTNLTSANPGDVLFTWMTLTNFVNNVCESCPPFGQTQACGPQFTWEIGMKNVTDGHQTVNNWVLDPCSPNSSFPDDVPLSWLVVAVLEEYNVNWCPDPSHVDFGDIFMDADQNQSNPTAQVNQSPNLQVGTTTQNPPSCFYGASGPPSNNQVTLD
jgi:hypothetical protein